MIYYKRQGFSASKKSNAKVPGAIMSGKGLGHISGLPVAKNAHIEAYYCPDKFVFIKGSQTITVSMDKVVSVDFLKNCPDGSDRNLSSAVITAGALAGNNGTNGVNAGVISVEALAMVMAGYLVITYVSGGEVKFIVLNAISSRRFAKEAQAAFKNSRKKKHMTVEL